eukprot:224022_1
MSGEELPKYEEVVTDSCNDKLPKIEDVETSTFTSSNVTESQNGSRRSIFAVMCAIMWGIGTIVGLSFLLLACLDGEQELQRWIQETQAYCNLTYSEAVTCTYACDCPDSKCHSSDSVCCECWGNTYKYKATSQDKCGNIELLGEDSCNSPPNKYSNSTLGDNTVICYVYHGCDGMMIAKPTWHTLPGNSHVNWA